HAPKRSCRLRSGLRPEQTLRSCDSGSGLGSFLQQLSNTLRRLCALTQPVGGTLLIDGQLDFRTLGDRIEETDTLNEATIARIAAVGHGQVVERALLGAATGETNSYHV